MRCLICQALHDAGDPSEHDLQLIRTRKPERPVLTVTMGDDSTRRVWCTFGRQQIDINPFSAPGACCESRILRHRHPWHMAAQQDISFAAAQ